MSKKTCDAFFCTKKTPKKYRYCYDCAKSKGLTGGGPFSGLMTLIMLALILLWIF